MAAWMAVLMAAEWADWKVAMMDLLSADSKVVQMVEWWAALTADWMVDLMVLLSA